jgi:tRNA threonylcarbamoyl adenosine modification protein YeaZ
VLLLGIDTATTATSVAVCDDAVSLAEVTTVDPRRHAEVLGPAIREVLQRADVSTAQLDAIAVGVGPGPYTGLRVGVAAAVALADALGVPARGLCTLDVLSLQSGLAEPHTAVTDARRREVFWATYDSAGARVNGPFVSRPSDVTPHGRVVGPGALLYADAFGDVAGPEQLSASWLCALATTAGAELLPARPIYLRRPDTAEPAMPKPVLQP